MRADSDPIAFVPEDHDVRLVRGEWVYYVRAIRRGERFVGGGLTPEGGLLALLLSRPLGAWHQRQPWKVGVVRFRRDHGGLVRTVHRERLADGVRPERRIVELLDDVRGGRFD